MSKYTDAIRDTIISYFNAGDQPTEAQFTDLATRIQEAIDEHDHSGAVNGDGMQLDWDDVWSDAVHNHSSNAEGGNVPIASLGGNVRGSILAGGAVNWVVTTAKTNHFILAGDGTDIVSKPFDWDDMAAGAAADMVHSHASAAEGGQLDWDTCWSDAVHNHANAGEGGQLDWDTCWSDAVHSHLSNAEGGVLCNHVRAATNAAQTFTNNVVATVVYEDEEYDTGTEYVAATGIFTAGRTGYLHFDAFNLFGGSAGWAAAEDVEMYIYVNGVSKGCIGRGTGWAAGTIYVEISGSGSVYVTSGQTVTIRIRQRSGGDQSLLNIATYNWVTFDWMP